MIKPWKHWISLEQLYYFNINRNVISIPNVFNLYRALISWFVCFVVVHNISHYFAVSLSGSVMIIAAHLSACRGRCIPQTHPIWFYIIMYSEAKAEGLTHNHHLIRLRSNISRSQMKHGPNTNWGSMTKHMTNLDCILIKLNRWW